jgi:hypothetical protein
VYQASGPDEQRNEVDDALSVRRFHVLDDLGEHEHVGTQLHLVLAIA